MQIGQPANLHWLWWVTFVIAVVAVAMARHQAARRAFATPDLLRSMTSSRPSRGPRAVLLSTLALVGIVLGLLDIRWERAWREVPQRGIEVMFVLDVSRSMLAQDVSPNRLERSKQYIKDMIQEMAGDRVGLVLFAGDVKKQIPLTNHYGDYAESLEAIGPQNIERGGSNLATAIEVAADSFLDKTSDHRAIVLFTDGEYHEKEPVDVAQRAFDDRGTRIFTVGIGDSDTGAKIPTPNRRRGPGETFLQYEGETVVSKQNHEILERIALNTNGAYIPAGTKNVDMAAVYHQFIANIEEREFDTARINAYVPRYRWFLGSALLLLIVNVLWPSRKSRPRATTDEAQGDAPQGLSRGVATAVALCLVAGYCSETVAQDNTPTEVLQEESVSPERLVQLGQTALRNGDATTALERFEAARDLGFSDPRLSYNMGIAHYNEGDPQAAREAFAEAAAAKDRSLAGNARFNLANTHYAEAVQQMEQDPAAAMAHLQQAIDHYRGALANMPNDQDSRANIELADRLRRQIQQQQQQQPNEDQGESQQQEQEQRDSDPQRQDAQQDQESPDQEQNPQRNDEQEQEQEQGQEQGQEAQQNQNDAKQGQDSDNQQPSESDEDSQSTPEAGKSSESEDRSNEPQESQESAESTGEENQDASPNGELEAINDPQDTPASERRKDGPPMTMQEARKLLQAVRDREFRNRLEQLRRMRPRRIPVDKDW